MSSSPTSYLISGAGRGIGFKLVEELSKRPNTIVFAGVRSFPPKEGDELAKLASRLPDVVIPIKLTSSDEEDNKAAAQVVAEKTGGKIDVVIANAGASTGLTPISSVSATKIRSDFEINTLGPIILYQSFEKLLKESGGNPKFIIISSVLGQIKDSLPYSYNAYGISKAGANFIAKKIDQEIPEIISFPMHPGMVDTDMGRAGAASIGLTPEQLGAISPSTSVAGILNVIDNATKEKHGGKFWSYTGDELTY